MWFLGLQDPTTQVYLNWFSHFCRVHGRDQHKHKSCWHTHARTHACTHTNKQTKPTTCVAIGRILFSAQWCGLIIWTDPHAFRITSSLCQHCLQFIFTEHWAHEKEHLVHNNLWCSADMFICLQRDANNFRMFQLMSQIPYHPLLHKNPFWCWLPRESWKSGGLKTSVIVSLFSVGIFTFANITDVIQLLLLLLV